MKYFLYVATVLSMFVLSADAAPLVMGASSAASINRPCSHKGITSQTVAAGVASARTGTAIPAGSVVQVTCLNNAFVDFGIVSNTAVADGSDVYLSSGVPYWFLIESAGDFLAFIKRTGEADSVCYISECR